MPPLDQSAERLSDRADIACQAPDIERQGQNPPRRPVLATRVRECSGKQCVCARRPLKGASKNGFRRPLWSQLRQTVWFQLVGGVVKALLAASVVWPSSG